MDTRNGRILDTHKQFKQNEIEKRTNQKRKDKKERDFHFLTEQIELKDEPTNADKPEEAAF